MSTAPRKLGQSPVNGYDPGRSVSSWTGRAIMGMALSNLPLNFLSPCRHATELSPRCPRSRWAYCVRLPWRWIGGALSAALDTITSGELRQHVSTLADDTFEGREAGSRGGRAAGHYLVQRLQSMELEPAGEDGRYDQPFGRDFRNILGVLRGADPELQQEVVILSAHYDHVGYGTRRDSLGPVGYIHNGADDNASGTAALLEVAQACLRCRRRLADRFCLPCGTARRRGCWARGIGSGNRPGPSIGW